VVCLHAAGFDRSAPAAADRPLSRRNRWRSRRDGPARAVSSLSPSVWSLGACLARVFGCSLRVRCGSFGWGRLGWFFYGDLGGDLPPRREFSPVVSAGDAGRDRGSHVVAEQGAGLPHPAVPR
jgi:hypothetical protein